MSRSGGIDAMIEAIAGRTDNSFYLVEPLYEARFSPNVEVVVEPGMPPRAGASEQVLDRSLTYVGSAYPSRARRLPRMIAESLSIVDWMRERGFTGRVGFDFVELEGRGGEPEHFMTEINPRINGASYPLALVRRLAARAVRRRTPVPAAFRTGYVPVRTSGFDELAALTRGLLYDPARGEGVVPYSVGALALGKVGVACIGRKAEAVEVMLREFVRVAGLLTDRSTSADAA
jgi:hypothetical protein